MPMSPPHGPIPGIGTICGLLIATQVYRGVGTLGSVLGDSIGGIRGGTIRIGVGLARSGIRIGDGVATIIIPVITRGIVRDGIADGISVIRTEDAPFMEITALQIGIATETGR